MTHTVLLIQCADRKGIVARVSDFLYRRDANIVNSDQHSTDPEGGRFFMRIEFALDESRLQRATFETEWAGVANELGAVWSIHYSGARPRVGLLVSKQDHCLFDLLHRQRNGELPMDIALVISNHPDCRDLVERYGIPFHHIPVAPKSQRAAERAMLDLVADSTDFLVLARYMRILSSDFLASYAKDIINIHHSFLPSFKGADPYTQAYERGVKLIGATAHFVTGELDEGPIIEQMVERVYYKDSIEDLKRKGRTIENLSLASAILAYLEHRIIRFENKTVVFQ
ncbi:MAG TPA: formyltetrahydrofolate deformylase [Candidatus Hydrogenedentes bacterium]|nr:formyltetrahydrofolate deformylase [Candidatus Hydrogenedentota bacterium]